MQPAVQDPAPIPQESIEPSQILNEPASAVADIESVENGKTVKEYNFGSVNVDDDGNIDDGKEDSGPFM